MSFHFLSRTYLYTSLPIYKCQYIFTNINPLGVLCVLFCLSTCATVLPRPPTTFELAFASLFWHYSMCIRCIWSSLCFLISLSGNEFYLTARVFFYLYILVFPSTIILLCSNRVHFFIRKKRFSFAGIQTQDSSSDKRVPLNRSLA